MIFNLMRSVPVAEPKMYLYGHVATADETPTVTIDGVGYVGLVAPELPEWDKETYPYAVMEYSMVGVYFAVYGKNATVLSSSGYIFFGYDSGTPPISQYWKYDKNADIWVHEGVIQKHNSSITWISSFGYVRWANFDIEYEGTLYLSATEPMIIP